MAENNEVQQGENVEQSTSLVKIESSEVKIDTLNIFVNQLKKGTELLQSNKVINSAQELVKATENLGKAKKLINLVNKEVVSLCEPLKAMKRKIDEGQNTIKERAAEMTKALSDISSEVEKAILEFNKAESLRVQKEQEEQQKLIQEKTDEIRNLGPLASDEEIAEATKQAEQEVIRPVVSAPSIKGLTVTWKYEIIDPSKVPVQYCSPDTTKIQTAVRSGVREIPGVKIFKDEKIRAGR